MILLNYDGHKIVFLWILIDEVPDLLMFTSYSTITSDIAKLLGSQVENSPSLAKYKVCVAHNIFDLTSSSIFSLKIVASDITPPLFMSPTNPTYKSTSTFRKAKIILQTLIITAFSKAENIFRRQLENVQNILMDDDHDYVHFTILPLSFVFLLSFLLAFNMVYSFINWFLWIYPSYFKNSWKIVLESLQEQDRKKCFVLYCHKIKKATKRERKKRRQYEQKFCSWKSKICFLYIFFHSSFLVLYLVCIF